jgi:hypothetical protein
MYADIVLDCLKQRHPMIFTAAHVAEWMSYDTEKVTKGLKMLEREFPGLVQDKGALGWFFDLKISIPLYCGLRRLLPPSKS